MQQGFVHPSRAHFIKPSSQKSKQPLRSALSKRHHATKRPPAVVESTKPNEDDLLVFGYASKLFPPDKHSASVAKNLHLIKWNEDGHANILIDRYDCRASLHDLSEFDGNSWNKKHQLSEEEVRLETYLDDERYRALHVEELEENIRQEEELKRLHAVINETPSSKFSQVQFRYDNDNSDQESQKDRYNPCDPTNDEEEVDEKPFFAPASLAVPEEMEIPATEKMHAIIEKTAKFVSKQGAQMEIVLKAKQSSNSQFQFLQFGHYLNPYYKHIVTRIKEGKYNPEVQETKDKSEAEESDSGSDDDSEGGGYLHPSLFAATHKSREAENLEKTKAIRTVDPNHPLAKLIEKGRAANAVKQHQKMAESMQDYYKSNNTANGNTNAETTNATLPPFMSMSGHTTSIQQPTSTIQSEDTSHTQRYITTAVQIVPPPPDLQPVVENIARRVAMEGGGLEATIFTTNPVTFGFLNPTHELHPYYHYRKLAWVKHLYPDPTAQTKPQFRGCEQPIRNK
nr:splicing factor, suppressor of white-apricot homolog isoform X1 [Ciona intestinalis]|eukprot:XP_026692111.1 splicing factor, suppressor of white-apricot homolog isoform X1 [Ciona intestinalis]